MFLPLSPDDAELDAMWREAFGQPLPLLGAPDIARAILAQHDPSGTVRRRRAD